MPFVKLDCGILNSTLWFEREARELFITALLMAEPIETTEPTPQIAIGSLEYTGWYVPPGWYGFVPAASVGIIHRAKVPEAEGMEAMKRLGEPEDTSRSPDFEGRRLVRVDGGFIVLNYMKYRERDYTTAERSKRYRQRLASRRDKSSSHRDITQAEAEAEVEVQAEEDPKTTKSASPEDNGQTRTNADSPRTPSLIVSPLQFDALKKKNAFVGSRLRIPNVLHDELRTKTGSDGETKLQAWYLILDEQVEASGEAIPDIFVWLRPRHVAWCQEQGLVKAQNPVHTGRVFKATPAQQTSQACTNRIKELMQSGQSKADAIAQASKEFGL